MTFKYLGVEITPNQDRDVEVRLVRDQAIKTARVSLGLRDIIGNNKYMNRKAKVSNDKY